MKYAITIVAFSAGESSVQVIGEYDTSISDEVVHRGGVLLHNSCHIIVPENLHNESNISSGVRYATMLLLVPV